MEQIERFDETSITELSNSIHKAASENPKDIVQTEQIFVVKLLKSAVKIDIPNIVETTIKAALQSEKSGCLISEAIKTNESSLASRLIEAGANVNDKDDLGNTPLFYSVFHSNTSIFQMLLENDADYFTSNNNGDNLLCILDKKFNDYPHKLVEILFNYFLGKFNIEKTYQELKRLVESNANISNSFKKRLFEHLKNKLFSTEAYNAIAIRETNSNNMKIPQTNHTINQSDNSSSETPTEISFIPPKSIQKDDLISETSTIYNSANTSEDTNNSDEATLPATDPTILSLVTQLLSGPYTILENRDTVQKVSESESLEYDTSKSVDPRMDMYMNDNNNLDSLKDHFLSILKHLAEVCPFAYPSDTRRWHLNCLRSSRSLSELTSYQVILHPCMNIPPQHVSPHLLYKIINDLDTLYRMDINQSKTIFHSCKQPCDLSHKLKKSDLYWSGLRSPPNSFYRSDNSSSSSLFDESINGEVPMDNNVQPYGYIKRNTKTFTGKNSYDTSTRSYSLPSSTSQPESQSHSPSFSIFSTSSQSLSPDSSLSRTNSINSTKDKSSPRERRAPVNSDIHDQYSNSNSSDSREQNQTEIISENGLRNRINNYTNSHHNKRPASKQLEKNIIQNEIVKNLKNSEPNFTRKTDAENQDRNYSINTDRSTEPQIIEIDNPNKNLREPSNQQRHSSINTILGSSADENDHSETKTSSDIDDIVEKELEEVLQSSKDSSFDFSDTASSKIYTDLGNVELNQIMKLLDIVMFSSCILALPLLIKARNKCGSKLKIKWNREPSTIGGSFIVTDEGRLISRFVPQKITQHEFTKAFKDTLVSRNKLFGILRLYTNLTVSDFNCDPTEEIDSIGSELCATTILEMETQRRLRTHANPSPIIILWSSDRREFYLNFESNTKFSRVDNEDLPIKTNLIDPYYIKNPSKIISCRSLLDQFWEACKIKKILCKLLNVDF